MNLLESIALHKTEFVNLCEEHEVKSLYAFGSSVTGNFNEETSDIDLLVELTTEDPIERGQSLLDLWDKLEAFFHRKVDLLTYKSLRNPMLRQSIDASKVLIYDGSK